MVLHTLSFTVNLCSDIPFIPFQFRLLHIHITDQFMLVYTLSFPVKLYGYRK